ncbi:MAG: cbb3-type cytochrome c oxidase subunit I [Candidatus Marsarchaeota archaeon]|nr:cbb3-type cytochrome c oxidase subunit I [Candidatus Marsarchaeota archaeon]
MDNVSASSKLARLYMAVAFAYLLIGTVILALDLTGLISIQHDSVFILELYGFVTMMIFGLSYIFAPGLSHATFANYKSVAVEFAALNIGIILLFISMAGVVGAFGKVFLPIGIILLIIGIMIHVANIWHIMVSGKGIKPMQKTDAAQQQK